MESAALAGVAVVSLDRSGETPRCLVSKYGTITGSMTAKLSSLMLLSSEELRESSTVISKDESVEL